MDVKRYLSMKDVGELFGVPAATVSKWRGRYAGTGHPTPVPAVWIGDPSDGGTPGWDDAAGWRAWKETLPGQGHGGGPLPLGAAAEELARAVAQAGEQSQGDPSEVRRIALGIAAARYGVDAVTVMAVWSGIAEETGNMDVEELDLRAVATVMRGRKRLEPGG